MNTEAWNVVELLWRYCRAMVIAGFDLHQSCHIETLWHLTVVFYNFRITSVNDIQHGILSRFSVELQQVILAIKVNARMLLDPV